MLLPGLPGCVPPCCRSACARVPHQEALNAQEYSAYTEVSFGLPAWWKTTNDSLVDVLVLKVSLAGQASLAALGCRWRKTRPPPPLAAAVPCPVWS